ncbi:MAG TPA: CARDB domain-containing protein [Solirubrobacterales bacterium]|nr:CARDB domain-containing protein [Solirubrobacterales bacterium]
MLRRAIALGAGLLVAILLVLGVRGCLNARKERALEDYARDVSTIVEETDGTSDAFFKRLEDPGSLSIQDFVNEVNADRSAMESYLSRVDSLDTPGDMSAPQDALELVYELRADALTDVGDKLPTGLGEAGREQAVQAITDDVRTLFASDRVYEDIAQPGIQSVLDEEGIEAEAPKSQFVPDGLVWLDSEQVDSALGEVSGSTASANDGLIHGLGLVGASLDGSTLQDGVPVTVQGGGTPQLDVQVMNQGEAEESGVTVTVSVDGDTLEEQLQTIGPGETQTVSIPLTPAPTGDVTLEVEVEPVAGEEVSENNVASYPVTFG